MIILQSTLLVYHAGSIHLNPWLSPGNTWNHLVVLTPTHTYAHTGTKVLNICWFGVYYEPNSFQPSRTEQLMQLPLPLEAQAPSFWLTGPVSITSSGLPELFAAKKHHPRTAFPNWPGSLKPKPNTLYYIVKWEVVSPKTFWFKKVGMKAPPSLQVARMVSKPDQLKTCGV